MLPTQSPVEFAYFPARMPGRKYVEYDTGEFELYDLTTDLYELENLAGLPAHASKQSESALVLDNLLVSERPLDLLPPSSPTPTATTPIPSPTATPGPLDYRTWLPLVRR